MVLLIQYTLFYAAVLIMVALGGMYSERSGVINIGLEGIMVIGALGGAMMMTFLPEDSSLFATFILTVLASVFAGMVFSLLLAVAAINFKADQTLVGTALNMLATAAATVIVKAYNMAITGKNSTQLSYLVQRSKLMLQIGDMQISWLMVAATVLFIIATVLLYKTRFGLRLRSCGEHPQAAASVGINVYKMRYIGVLISGFLGGLGGIIYITVATNSWSFDMGVAGVGFLSLAVMIFGQWKPIRIALAALLFGVFYALANVYTGISFLTNLGIGSSIYRMLPYIVSLIVLAFTSKKSRAPKAEGIPYDKGAR